MNAVHGFKEKPLNSCLCLCHYSSFEYRTSFSFSPVFLCLVYVDNNSNLEVGAINLTFIFCQNRIAHDVFILLRIVHVPAAPRCWVINKLSRLSPFPTTQVMGWVKHIACHPSLFHAQQLFVFCPRLSNPDQMKGMVNVSILCCCCTAQSAFVHKMAHTAL